ncbi:hypothetical protein BDW74DRAFT_180090 [Aspergillus multicolor]|uniref:uncharacterized protein n=1 Tax=Aspergillus multicolor TaxID=41759 RepID=UPI003CCCD4CD
MHVGSQTARPQSITDQTLRSYLEDLLASITRKSTARDQTARAQPTTAHPTSSNVCPSTYQDEHGSNPLIIPKSQQHLVHWPPHIEAQRHGLGSGPKVRPLRANNSVQASGGIARATPRESNGIRATKKARSADADRASRRDEDNPERDGKYGHGNTRRFENTTGINDIPPVSSFPDPEPKQSSRLLEPRPSRTHTRPPGVRPDSLPVTPEELDSTIDFYLGVAVTRSQNGATPIHLSNGFSGPRPKWTGIITNLKAAFIQTRGDLVSQPCKACSEGRECDGPVWRGSSKLAWAWACACAPIACSLASPVRILYGERMIHSHEHEVTANDNDHERESESESESAGEGEGKDTPIARIQAIIADSATLPRLSEADRAMVAGHDRVIPFPLRDEDRNNAEVLIKTYEDLKHQLLAVHAKRLELEKKMAGDQTRSPQ